MFGSYSLPDDCHHGTIGAQSSQRWLKHCWKNKQTNKQKPDFLNRVSQEIFLGLILVNDTELKA